MAIYQADHFPGEWRNRLLTWNQHGRRLNRERLKRKGSGYVGKHETDVFENSNEWFRGMEVSVGPDGAIYGLDWSDTGECHDHTGVHRTSGRIYKFFHQKNPVADLSILENRFDDLEAVIRHPNVWYFRQFLQNLSVGSLTEREKYSMIRICELNFVGRQPTPIRLRAMWGLYALNKLISESYLDDPNENIRAWLIRLMVDEQPIDTLFGPREKEHYSIEPEIVQKLVQQAITDESGLVRLTLASALQRLPIELRGDLAQALAFRSEDKKDHNLPMVVWAGITPLVEHDLNGLIEIARATQWPSLRTWIARAVTEQSAQQPLEFNSLLDLLVEQPKYSDSLLVGIERAVLGMKEFKKPDRWELVLSKLGKNPQVLKLSVLFGDEQATERMEKLVVNAQADPSVRRRSLKILIDSDSTNLKVLCGKLLNDPEMQVLAVRGLSQFEDLEIGKKLVDKLPDFSRQELDEVVGFLCGRVNWTGFMLEEMEKGNISRSVISPYHATQILALNNKELNEKLDRVWGVVRTSPDTMSERKIELKKELNAGHLANANLVNGRTHYDLQCGACHKLYGQGGKLGPDLTGSGRSNLDYLLENIVDPDSAVSADYRMNIIHLKDGRTLSGMIAGQDRNSLTLRMPGSDTVVSKSMVEKRETLSHSIMPAGLLDNLSLNARRDLIAYLMNPTQVSRPAQ
jgi:putative heme-binding domain-containing protein